MRETIHFDDYFSAAANPIDALRFLIRCGAHAPSSHNSQPWRFAIVDNSIEIRAEERRTLPASDPNYRQLFISLGCALKNICVAADLYELRYAVDRFPNPKEPFFAARIRFETIAPAINSLPERHPAFAINDRHNNRSDFDIRKKIPSDFLVEARSSAPSTINVQFVDSAEALDSLSAIVADATEAAFEDKAFTNELSHWIKPSLKKYRYSMPGYNLGIPWPISFLMPLALRKVDMKKPQRSMAKQMLSTAPMFMVLSTTADAPEEWLAAGETLEEIWLMGEQQGIKIGVLTAAIQIGDFYKKIQEVLHSTGRPQVFCRLGFSDSLPIQSPRFSVDDVTA